MHDVVDLLMKYADADLDAPGVLASMSDEALLELADTFGVVNDTPSLSADAAWGWVESELDSREGLAKHHGNRRAHRPKSAKNPPYPWLPKGEQPKASSGQKDGRKDYPGRSDLSIGRVKGVKKDSLSDVGAMLVKYAQAGLDAPGVLAELSDDAVIELVGSFAYRPGDEALDKAAQWLLDEAYSREAVEKHLKGQHDQRSHGSGGGGGGTRSAGSRMASMPANSAPASIAAAPAAQEPYRPLTGPLHDRLVSQLTQLDARQYAQEAKRGRGNIYRLGLYFEAADRVKADMDAGATPEKAFTNNFTPSREMHGVARRLGLKLDVQRGQWVHESPGPTVPGQLGGTGAGAAVGSKISRPATSYPSNQVSNAPTIRWRMNQAAEANRSTGATWRAVLPNAEYARTLQP